MRPSHVSIMCGKSLLECNRTVTAAEKRFMTAALVQRKICIVPWKEKKIKRFGTLKLFLIARSNYLQGNKINFYELA